MKDAKTAKNEEIITTSLAKKTANWEIVLVINHYFY